MTKGVDYFASRDLIAASKQNVLAVPPMKIFRLNVMYERFVVAAQIRAFDWNHAARTICFAMYGSPELLIVQESNLSLFYPLNVGDVLVLSGDFYITVPYGDFIQSVKHEG